MENAARPHGDGETGSLMDEVERLKLELAALRRSADEIDVRYRQILASATDYAIILMDREGTVTAWNAGAENILGWLEAEMVGRRCDRIFIEEDLATGIPGAEQKTALTSGRSVDERWHVRKDGSRFWSSGTMTPLRHHDCEPVGFLKILRDRTAERQAEWALRASEKRLRAIFDGALEYAIFTMTKGGRITSWNVGAARMFGYTSVEILGRNAAILFIPEDRDAGIPARERDAVLHDGRVTSERWHMRKDGGRFWGSGFAMGLGGNDMFLKIMRDDTARRRVEEAQQALIGELNHRVKNILTIVQAVALQSLRNAPTREEGMQALLARIQALSRAHDLLTQRQWERTDFAGLVRRSLEAIHGSDADGRFLIAGPPVEVRPTAALTLVMALHELDTNAVKYGALATDTGRVEIIWVLVPDPVMDRFHFEWRETGGPTVTPPTRRGFGSRLIETGLARDLRGEAHLLFEPTGLRCVIDVPVGAISGSS